MGCTSSKESTPQKPKREILYGSNTNNPTERYLSEPAPKDSAPKHVRFDSSAKKGPRSSDEAARPKETFEAYARRGVFRESALLPEGTRSRRTEHLSHKKRVGGWEKYALE